MIIYFKRASNKNSFHKWTFEFLSFLVWLLNLDPDISHACIFLLRNIRIFSTKFDLNICEIQFDNRLVRVFYKFFYFNRFLMVGWWKYILRGFKYLSQNRWRPLGTRKKLFWRALLVYGWARYVSTVHFYR